MTGIQKYLDSAVQVLKTFGYEPKQDETSRAVKLLDEINDVDPARVLAIGRVLQYESSFNALVREQVREVSVGERYKDITDSFTTIREDADRMMHQLDDGQIDTQEKISNAWMRFRRGSISDRFTTIRETYNDVSADLEKQIKTERDILTAYGDFRVAYKDVTAVAYEVEEQQKRALDAAQAAVQVQQGAVEEFAGSLADKTRVEGDRDLALRGFQTEQRKYNLIHDIAEQMKIGYQAGEAVMAKLAQTNEMKDAVYRRSVTFFSTNEHVITAIEATLVAQKGLHEGTQTLEALTEGVNQGLETIASMGTGLEAEARKAAYGVTIRAKSLKSLVDAIVLYQESSIKEIGELRAQATANAREIESVVEEGKQRMTRAIAAYAVIPAN